MSQIRDYQWWNNALGHHFFNATRAYQDVYLTTDREVLSLVSGLSPDEAESSFLTAIRTVCSQGAKWERDGLLYYRVDPLGWRPFCVGLLCFQVYVAYQMEDVADERRQTNYWGVMNMLLGNGLKSGYPGNLTTELQQKLWRDCLEEWANSPKYHEQRLGRLVLPPPYSSWNHHIALPLSQALLRREDCLRLHNFFYAADLRPGDEIGPDSLYHLLLQTTFQPSLTSHAWTVFNDEQRREPALHQLIDELNEWDGATLDRGQKRSLYKMWIRFNKRRPEKLRCGIGLVKHDVLEDEISTSLSALLQNQVSLDGVPYRISSPRDYLRLLVLNESLGCYLDQRYLGPQQEAIILVSGDLGRCLLKELRSAGIAYGEFTEVELPRGWQFIWLEAPLQLPRLPDWLNIFEPSKISIRPFGGVKLRPGVWMEGAGPALRVLGEPLPEFAWIDGHRVEMQQGILQHPCLNKPGEHLVVVPRRGINSYIHVEEPNELATFWPPVWARTEEGWPTPTAAASELPENHLLGLQVTGNWPKVAEKKITEPVQRKPEQVADKPSLSPPVLIDKRPDPPIPQPKEIDIVKLPPVPMELQAPDLTQQLLVKMLVSLKRGIPLVSKEELHESKASSHPIVRALAPRLHALHEEFQA